MSLNNDILDFGVRFVEISEDANQRFRDAQRVSEALISLLNCLAERSERLKVSAQCDLGGCNRVLPGKLFQRFGQRFFESEKCATGKIRDIHRYGRL